MKEFNDNQMKKLKQFYKMSDVEFYEQFVADAPLKDQMEFMQEFPEFLEEKMSETELESDGIYQRINTDAMCD